MIDVMWGYGHGGLRDGSFGDGCGNGNGSGYGWGSGPDWTMGFNDDDYDDSGAEVLIP